MPDDTDSNLETMLAHALRNSPANKFSRRYWAKRQAQSDAVAERFIDVPEKRVDAFIMQSFMEASQLQALLDTIDPEFQDYESLTCCKSGRPIGQESVDAISECIALNGSETAHHYLRIRGKQQLHPAWIRTDDKALHYLMHADPVGFFVYFSTQLFSHTKANGTVDSQWLLHLERRKLYQQLAPTAKSLPRELAITNEKLRRVLSLADVPHLQLHFKRIELFDNIDSDALYLAAWITACNEAAQFLVAKHQQKRMLARQEHLRTTVSAFATAEDIADIRLEFGGNKALQLAGHSGANAQQHADEDIAMSFQVQLALDAKVGANALGNSGTLKRQLATKQDKFAVRNTRIVPRGEIRKPVSEGFSLPETATQSQPQKPLFSKQTTATPVTGLSFTLQRKKD